MDICEQSTKESFINNEDDCISYIHSFKANNISTVDLLLTDPSITSRKINKRNHDLTNFVNKYEDETYKNMIAKSYRLSDKNESQPPLFFTTGDEQLDNILHGGIPTGYLIEISGRSSTGKTNLLLAFSITIQLPIEFGGLGPSIFSNSESIEESSVKTMYIPTESMLPTSRLDSIVEHYTNLLKANGINDSKFYPSMNNVLTTSTIITDMESQDHILFYQLPAMLAKDKSIKSIIIDSITHHVRAEMDWLDRDNYILKILKFLKKLSSEFNLTILIANQVTDKPVTGIYAGDNDLLYKLNVEYQMSWVNGWYDVGVVYRQLMRRNGIVDNAADGFEKLDYLDEIVATENDEAEIKSKFENLKNHLRSERKKLFESSYKIKVSGITTRPALGLELLNFVDMRIMLAKESRPILGEELIDEFSFDLGIDTSEVDDSNLNSSQSHPEKKNYVDSLMNNTYLKNYNFETVRCLKCLFSPLIPSGEHKPFDFEIWKGGIRHT